MAKKDELILLNFEEIERLHTQMLLNPEEAKRTLINYMSKMRGKVENTYSVDQIKKIVAEKFNTPVEEFTTTKNGFKHSAARPRRFLTVLLTHFTTLSRRQIMEVCGYSHNSSISLAIKETAGGIQAYKADAELYKELVENLQQLKNQS